MKNNKTITAILLAAGNSTRYGKNVNKNFEYIDGKSILAYSLNLFEENEFIDDIIVAVKLEEQEIVKNIIKEENLKKKIKIITGGKTRKESVYNCLLNTNSDIVLIHDGARPLIKQEYINNCLNEMVTYKGVTNAVKAKDTIKICDENNHILETTKRSNTWITQTPQCFNKDILLKAHEKHKEDDVTDDCQLLEMENYKVKIINCGYENIKITTGEDIDIIKNYIKRLYGKKGGNFCETKPT